MCEEWMGCVAQVLEVYFPIAVIGVLEHAARDLDLTIWGAVDHVVERGRHVAEEFLQSWSVARLAGKNKTAIAFYAWHSCHRSVGIFRIEVSRIAVLQRYRLQPAV